ncbi:lipopolysaccharide transport periplasmic protein LptA [Testudinibacter sp. TR-2022]|uniref:lipopolysaccharide transport periplasmic protein LptA n=1 Tax=Testudinibacter sp. TR-2022 TaxID=2585029 RepID=UPI001119831D|nr:lipopolysaccharide transport periplasmic protein LptA [Testudinibacter sp. TR-2022]TNH04004.1 lipopolysaccharide transport periplasmic protein LptA [Pasteurellaceae bacterium Phil31]TNH08808.1 lipopolysaccharide transport periplasmic protein LptA [Testudinibacter sp. TR-2022]TNH11408.1 lipopolysaccharide transport periplasmic protein LptA [Testudinibacter sp. TR-2022]TNH11484.1 lipopolysaccharide transport periplasmic protein LptA [Testudinibacter sp. TR-2022]TNH17411.1 lipopolysaccharide t
MKTKIIKSLTLVSVLLLSFSAFALKNDSQQPINITSDNQSLDLENNIVTFTDNVVITQGSILINARQVTITRPDNNGGGKEKIEANGSPVTFQQQLDNGKMINGRANKVNYDLGSQYLVLTGNAQLKQLDSQIDAEVITYDVQQQKMIAKNSGKGRVKTILYPSQLQQK